MKWLIVLLAAMLCIGNALIVVHRQKECDALKDKIFQQQYQLEVLVSRFNNKQPGEVAELQNDGTVDYWTTYHHGMVDSLVADTTYYYR